MTWTKRPMQYMGHDGLTEAIEIIDPEGKPFITLDIIGVRQEGGEVPLSKDHWRRELERRAAVMVNGLNGVEDVQRQLDVVTAAAIKKKQTHIDDVQFQMDKVKELEKSIDTLNAEALRLVQERDAMTKRKDEAYEERNRVVAFLAHISVSLGWTVGLARTAIEGWDEDWHGCVYIETPQGQLSWHFHDSHARFFEGLPQYTKPWDGHTTIQKYARIERMTDHSGREDGHAGTPACAEGWCGCVPRGFEYDLKALLNRHSKENDSNTPDFILANFVLRCLEAFTVTTRERERWYGWRHVPGKEPIRLAEEPLKDIVQVIEETNPGAHVEVMHGDEERKGVADRWSWSCRCGTGSKRKDMTIVEARRDFGEHLALVKQCGF